MQEKIAPPTKFISDESHKARNIRSTEQDRSTSKGFNLIGTLNAVVKTWIRLLRYIREDNGPCACSVKDCIHIEEVGAHFKVAGLEDAIMLAPMCQFHNLFHASGE